MVVVGVDAGGGARKFFTLQNNEKEENQKVHSWLALGPLPALRASPASSALPALAWTCYGKMGRKNESV